MFKNIYYNTSKSKIHLWEEIKGQNFYDEIDFAPYCFVPDNNGEILTTYGKKVSRKDFQTHKEYNDFCKSAKEVYENQMSPVIQFLTERYHKFIFEEMVPPKLKIYSLDIEVGSSMSGEFPNTKDTKFPITLISILDCHTDSVYTFGTKPWTSYDKNVFYFHYHNERDMMKGFFQWWRKNTPDVLSGWNICSDFKVNITGGFDLPYIINRSKVLFGEDSSDYRKLSPIGIVNCFYKKEADTFSIDIAGISVLDYMALYKWYTTKNLESYSLETVCQHELGEGKLSYEGDLNDLYEGDYNKYVEYNIKDVRLIKRLEEKLNYILLAQSLCLLCKCPMKNYNSTTNLVEGLMLTRFRRAGKCAPYFAGGHQSEFEGGFVKPPIVGKHNWIFGMDITSSYPFAMITLNMSQETLYGKITGFNNEEVKNFVRNNNFPEFRLIKNNNIIEIKDKLLISFNKAIEKKLFSISPNGVVFHNSPIGSYASMIRDVFLKRKELKRKMAKKKKQYKETPSEKLKNEINVLNTTQWAQKIIINGSYGCSSVPYSRYFSQDIAEAITSVGQESLKSGIRFVNDLLNKPNKELMDIINSISVENV